MLKSRNRNKKGLVDRLMKGGLVFGTLVMLFMATMASVGVFATAGADEGGELLVSIKGMDSSLSPDWKKVAFRNTEELYKNSLWIVDSDGSNLKKLTEKERVDYVGSWSPKGDKILYWVYNLELGTEYTPSYNRQDLWIINSDGSNKKKLAELGKHGIWSPDGNKIAYFGDGIHVVNADGSDDKRIAGGIAGGRILSWTPDSKKIMIPDGGIVIDVESGVIQKPINIPIIPYGFDVSPDASKIAYKGFNYGIWVVNLDGSGLKQLTYSDDRFIQWSPDSKRIAFISMEKGIRCGVWVMNSDGSNQKMIVELSDKDISVVQDISWNNDGSKIAYALYDSENKTTDIYTINVGKLSPIKHPTGEMPTEKQPLIPGFEALFAIAGLLAVAYLLRKR